MITKQMKMATRHLIIRYTELRNDRTIKVRIGINQKFIRTRKLKK